MQHVVGRETNGVSIALGFQEFVKLWLGKCGIVSEEQAELDILFRDLGGSLQDELLAE